MAKQPFYLAVAGVMGVGKTTASQILASSLNFHLLAENWGENQFLPRFYKNMPRWAFASQSFYLLEKIKQSISAKKYLKKGKSVIQDTPIVQDVLSYAKAQYILKNMDEAEFSLYTKIYAMFVKKLPRPDLTVFLQASWREVFKRLKTRDRGFEQKIPKSYLLLLDKLNRHWARKADKGKILRINTTGLNLVENSRDKSFLAEKVLESLTKKEGVKIWEILNV